MIDWEQKLSERIKENQSKNDKPRDSIRASLTGFCERQMLVSKLNLKDFDDYVLGSMLSGTVIHEWIEEEFKPKVDAEFEQPVEFEESNIKFTGRYDCYDGERVYDFKSQNGLKYVRDGPKDKHVDQLHTYMRAVGADEGAIVYIDKASYQTIQHRVEFDEKRWDKIKQKARRVIQQLNNVQKVEKHTDIPFDKCGCYFCDSEELNI